MSSPISSVDADDPATGAITWVEDSLLCAGAEV